MKIKQIVPGQISEHRKSDAGINDYFLAMKKWNNVILKDIDKSRDNHSM